MSGPLGIAQAGQESAGCKNKGELDKSVSPSATICYVEIFISSLLYVYGGNRFFAPILRQSLWSLLYDVY
jgi:hypothetical protein